jgi:hypothetical protein
MTDNSKRTGAAIEAHYRFVVWLVPTIEKFPKSHNSRLGIRKLELVFCRGSGVALFLVISLEREIGLGRNGPAGGLARRARPGGGLDVVLCDLGPEIDQSTHFFM